jgi:hypothetical protein
VLLLLLRALAAAAGLPRLRLQASWGCAAFVIV